jgi:hypothetical protein
VFALDALRETYPDARFVFLHRDPLEVLQSVARLTETLRRPFTRHVDRAEIGRQVSERWARGAQLLVAAAESANGAAVPACHFTFRRFVEDPVRAVAALYDHFELEFDDALAAQLRRVVAAQPNGGYGRNQYRLEEYGLDAGAERRRYQEYTTCFGV